MSKKPDRPPPDNGEPTEWEEWGERHDDALGALVDAARPELLEMVKSYGLSPEQTADVVRWAVLAVVADGVPRSLADGRRRILEAVEAQCRSLWRREEAAREADEDEPEGSSQKPS